MATTIRQVAAAAGVSVATASRAMSGSTTVLAETRQRVLHAATELDYTPSRLGRSLATGSTGNIGVILPDVTNPFYVAFLAELESTIGARDIGLLVGDSHESLESELRLIQRMTSQVDTLVLASSRLPDDAVVAAARRLPVVLANRVLRAGIPVPSTLRQLSIDIDTGFGDAVRHLHALGHRSITYLDGPAQSWSGRQKVEVLERVCRELGIALTSVATTRPDFEEGRAAFARLSGPPPSAIIAFNDQMALGVLSALREAGLDVPGEISVIGCDNSLAEGLAWPSLTTVDSSSRALGALAAQAVLDPGAPRTSTVQTRLIIRASTAPIHYQRDPMNQLKTKELS